MRASIISIGNSKGLRIPKVLLDESGLGSEVEIKASKGTLRITPAKPLNETAQLSEQALKRDWDRPDEDTAWADL